MRLTSLLIYICFWCLCVYNYVSSVGNYVSRVGVYIWLDIFCWCRGMNVFGVRLLY